MDKTQLITIAISALFGAIAKSLVEWLVTVVKSTGKVSAITSKIKILFSRTNRAVIFDFLSLSFYITVLINFALEKSLPTRLDILVAIGSILASILMVIFLFVDILKAINVPKKP